MKLLSILALAIALVEAKIAFTKTPGSSIVAGNSVTLEWDGGDDDAPVTITLKKGNSQSLRTVQLLTGNGQGGKYVWTPSKSLEDGEDYALQISQGTGDDQTNYSGEFAITGAAPSGSHQVTITSGSSSTVTTEPTSFLTTGTAGNATRSSNMTVTRATPSSTGGIQVSSEAPTTAAPSAAGPASSTSAGAAALVGPVSGLAAAMLGLVALL